LKENPKGAMPGMLLFQEIYAVKEIIKKEGKLTQLPPASVAFMKSKV